MNHATIMWMDNWYHAQFTVHPMQPHVSKNVTATALLHIIAVRPFTGHALWMTWCKTLVQPRRGSGSIVPVLHMLSER